MKPILTNEYLTVAFKEIGGELSSIKDASGVEYLWQGDSTYWGGKHPSYSRFVVVSEMMSLSLKMGREVRFFDVV